jgi:predicted metal-dependent hydrolase
MALHERGTQTLILSTGEEVEVRVRQSDRARTTRIVLGPERPPEIILAHRAAAESVGRLLEGRLEWITEKLAHARDLSEVGRQLGIAVSGELPFDGGRRLVEATFARVDRAITLSDGRVRVLGRSRSGMGDALARWYRREARRLIAPEAAREAIRLQVSFERLSVRDSRRRWGSCSPRGGVSFSWRLAMVPPEVRTYVIVHELLHLRIPNHARAFWRRLEVVAPAWRHATSWLQVHGAELLAYDPVVAVPTNVRHSTLVRP